jgi:hypothetical protein
MQIHVKTDIGYRGVEVLRRFGLDGREVEVIENVDQWQGRDYRYFKVKGDHGNLYILRFNERRADWELTMFQNPRAQTVRDAGQR